jgi:hypothetical protein
MVKKRCHPALLYSTCLSSVGLSGLPALGLPILGTQYSVLADHYFLSTGAGDASRGNILNSTFCECEVTFLFTSLAFSVSVPLSTK